MAYSRGKHLFEAGAYDRAQAEFERARAMDADYAPAYEGLSRVAFVQGNRDEAIRHIRTAKLKDINYVPTWIATGLLYTSVKRYKSAVVEFQEALRRDPENIWAVTTYFYLAQIYEQMGEDAQAYEAYMSVVKLDALHLEAIEALERVKKTLSPAYWNNPWR